MTSAIAQRLVGVAGGHEGRHQTERQAGRQRDDHREREHREIERDLVEPRNRDAIADQCEQAAQAQRRDAQPGDAAGGSQHQAFGQHLAHQAAALGAERGAQADLALARRASRQQQVGDVDAGDEHDQRDRADQREQRRAQLADQLFLQREDHHRAPGIALWLFFFELGVDGPHVAVGLLERHAVAKPRDGVGAAAAARRPQLLERFAVRRQEVRLLADDREAGRHHANHRPRTVVGGQGHPQHVGPAAELPLPELVGENDQRVVAAEVFLGGIAAAECGLDPQRAEERSRERQSGGLEWLAVDDQGQAGGSDHPQTVERAGALAPRHEVRRGDHVPDGPAAVGLPHRDDAIGLAVGQRLQHDGPDDAEDRRGGADAERQRQQGPGSEARRPPQHADAVAEITCRVLEHCPCHEASLLFGGRWSAGPLVPAQSGSPRTSTRPRLARQTTPCAMSEPEDQASRMPTAGTSAVNPRTNCHWMVGARKGL